MTNDQLASILTDLCEVHYPAQKMNGRQLAEIGKRLEKFSYDAAMDAIRAFARKHDFLNVEQLVAAVAELSQSRDIEASRQRSIEDDNLRAEIDEENRRVAAALDGLTDEDWAELVAEMKQTVDTIVINGRTITGKQGTFLGATFWARGRNDRAVRWMVYKHLKKHAHRRQEVMA
jgi:3-keto-L-gulonate-6-phosphate decarboxylase